MSRKSEKSYHGLWLVLAAVIVIGGIGAIILFTASWISDGRVETRAEELAKAKFAELAEQPQGAPPASVRVTPVLLEKLQQRVAVVGRLREVRRATVASQVEGRVIHVLVDVGDLLTGPTDTDPGTVVARVDDVWANLAIEQAQAELLAAQARANRARQDLKHLQELSTRGASDQQAQDDAKALVQVEEANVQASEAALHRAEETAARAEIYAPFDAKVTRKHTEVGQWLDPGSAVVEIVSRGEIDAVVDVPEQYISALAVGTAIAVNVEPLGQTLTGEVVAINPDGSNAARTYPVQIRLQDAEGRFKVGMSVTALVPIAEDAEYLTVPRDAVAFSATGAEVWMSIIMPTEGGSSAQVGGKDAENAPSSMPQAMPMQVKVLFGEGGRFAIRPLPKMAGMNLSQGTEVVIEGKEALWPTRPLIVVPPDQPLDLPGEPASADAPGSAAPESDSEATGRAAAVVSQPANQ